MIKFKKGFTLIELMIVVAIIGIISAVAVPKFAGLIRKSKEAATRGTLGTLRSALTIYYSDNEGWFPTGGDAYQNDITYLQDSLVPKFIAKWPACHVPPYHPATDTVDHYPSGTMWDATCDGEWIYDGNKFDSFWGFVCVECWDTDSWGYYVIDW